MTAITRLPDWRSRLTVHLQTVARNPFDYGQHDCALFTASCVEAMTGVDLAARYRGLYRSLKGGLKLLSSEGFNSPLAIVQAHFAQVPTAFAQVGDIMVLHDEAGSAAYGVDALGIDVGERIAVLRLGELGMAPRAAAIAAYRVP